MNSALLKILFISSVCIVNGCDNSEEQKVDVSLNDSVSHVDMNEFGESAEQDSHYAVGRIMTVDNPSREILVNLESVPKLHWSPEAKSFHVGEKENINKIQTGE